ncbi:hypothetical protein FBPa45_0125 [Pseudomonas phage vB_PaeS_FBPa45]|nr:hypothetical protein FBPa45_0125 [Pseudomonas phage vB_PaeS_FBPa45]WDS62483.1 hypothetical protein UFRH6_55 [Pseudomonas phage UF_RH6]HBO9768500.1 hypothetical protein [Pseudomonas aeruginosa]
MIKNRAYYYGFGYENAGALHALGCLEPEGYPVTFGNLAIAMSGSWQAKAFKEGFDAKRNLLCDTKEYAADMDRFNRSTIKSRAISDRIEKMAKGYIACALWASDGIHPETEEFLDSLEGFEAAPSFLAHAERTCSAFYAQNMTDCAAFVDLYPSRVSSEFDPWEGLGHDLWLTRNGHGAGFWDRGMGRVGERLSGKCGHGKAFAPLYPYLTDEILVDVDKPYHSKVD